MSEGNETNAFNEAFSTGHEAPVEETTTETSQESTEDTSASPEQHENIGTEPTNSNESTEEKVTEQEEKIENTEEESSESSLNNESQSTSTEESTEQNEAPEVSSSSTENQEESYEDNQEDEYYSASEITLETFQEYRQEAIKDYFDGELTSSEVEFFDNLDVEGTPDSDAIEIMYAFNNPDASDARIDHYMQDVALLNMEKGSDDWEDYLSENGLSEREANRIVLRYQEAIAEFEKFVPKVQSDIDDFNKNFVVKLDQGQGQSNNYIQTEEYQNSVDESINNFKNVTVSLKNEDGSDLFSIDSEITPEVSSKMAQVLKDPNVVYSLWMNEQGQFNEQAYLRDIARLIDYDKHMDIAYKEGLSGGKKNMIEDINNIPERGRTTSTDQGNKQLTSEERAWIEAHGGL